MPEYEVDSERQEMTATGIVDPELVWEERPGGGRRPTGEQAKDPATGLDLYNVEVMYRTNAFGRVATATGRVKVPCKDAPQLSPLTRVKFTGLRCEVRTLKSGGFQEYWSATGIDGSARMGRPAGNDGKAA